MDIHSFFQQFETTSFKKNDILLRPEETPKGIYYLESGYIKLYSITEAGDEKLNLIYKANEMFPLFWTFDDLFLTKYYEALTDSTVRIAPKVQLLQFIENNPQALNAIMKKMIKIMEVYSSRIDTLEYTSAHTRLCARLIYLSIRFGEKRGKQILIPVPLTHKDIASSISTARETTSREFEKLIERGLIRYVNHKILICDIKKLEQEISLQSDSRLL